MGADRKLCVVCAATYRHGETTCPQDGAVLVAEPEDDPRAPRLGQVIGNYRLLRILGEGGVGTVYEAEHIRLGRKVALKLMHPDVVTTELITRFFNEARAVNEIHHPNIIDVEDFVTTPTGEHYMLMELLAGEDLRSVISREGKLAPERVAAIAAQVASALAAVHAVGIIHRDLKPDNVFLIQEGGEEVAKLLDFGIAKFTDDTAGITRAGMTMGTPQYMAPEQIITGKEVGSSSDIYALGIVMYESLTGAPPFNSTRMANILRAQCFEVVVPPSQRRREPIPPVIEAAVMKCLEKDPDARFATAADLCDALVASTPVAYSQAVPPAPVSAHAAGAAATRRRRVRQLLPAVAIAGAALALHLWPHAAEPPTAVASALAPVAAPAAKPVSPPSPQPAPPPTIELRLRSEPAGAALFLGAERRPLGTSPATATLLLSHDPVALTARFADGREVTETLVPDRPRPELVLVAPPRATAVKPRRPPRPPATTSPTRSGDVKPPVEDRDATMDPFNP